MIVKGKNGETYIRFADALVIDVGFSQIIIEPVEGATKETVALKIRKINNVDGDEQIIINSQSANQILVQ
jgi:hypothetical protein